MSEEKKNIVFNITSLSQSTLLLALIGQLMILPLFEGSVIAFFLVHFAYTIIFFSGIVLLIRRRRELGPSLGVLLLLVPISWATYFSDQPWLFVISCVLSALFFAVLAVFLILRVVRHYWATAQSIIGALNAYLLVGLAFAMLYYATDRIENESLVVTIQTSASATTGDNDLTPFSQIVYFSFVTMTTLGYGDIHPETAMTRTLAWMQAVVGQFYIAVVVAWLISAIPAHKKAEEAKKKEQ